MNSSRMKSHSSGPRLLYLAESDSGGIAEYVKFQSEALAEAGLTVTLLCRKGYPHKQLRGVTILPTLPERPRGGNPFRRLISFLQDARTISRKLLQTVMTGSYDYVLMDCFREYFSPLWVGPFRKARRTGVRFGVVAHDPVRDFVIGPLWWHNLCIRQAYSFIDDVFVHEKGRIDMGGVNPESSRIHEIPHGPYAHPAPCKGRQAMRAELGFSSEDVVFLSFGQIRDGKNLDLFIRALAQTPETIKLLVAGRGDSESQKPPSYYQQLAIEAGVEERCKWLVRYIGDDEIADIFEAADFVLLTYSKAFVSASGVMNIAVEKRRPVLASGGAGPLKTAVTTYRIGRWLEELEPESMKTAVLELNMNRQTFEFDSYREAFSWARNAQVVKEAVSRKPHDG